MMTLGEMRYAQCPLVEAYFDEQTGEYQQNLLTPWFSPILIEAQLLECGDDNPYLSFVPPNTVTITCMNGEATYRLDDYHVLSQAYEAKLIKSWMDPDVYATWLAQQEARA